MLAPIIVMARAGLNRLALRPPYMFDNAAKPYRREILHFVGGEARGIEIIFRNYPIRVLDDGSETRLEYFPDFNARLMRALWAAIGDYASFEQTASDRAAPLEIAILDAPKFLAQIRMTTEKSERDFAAGLSDAVIAAFAAARIRR